ncbi:MAG: sensor histidine kinase [Bacteroidota bacterium]
METFAILSAENISIVFSLLFTLVGIHSLLLFLVLKNRIYFYYFLFTITLAFHVALRVVREYDAVFADQVSVLTATIASLLSLVFTNLFIDERFSFRSDIDWKLKTLFSAGALITSAHLVWIFLGYSILDPLTSISAAFLAILCVVYNLYLALKNLRRRQSARLYLYINLPMLLAALAFTLTWLGNDGEPNSSNLIIAIATYSGMLLQMLLFSVFTADRIRNAEKSKLSMQKDLNVKLSAEVEKQTASLTQAKQKLEKRKNELQIANELKAKLFTLVAHDLRSPLQNINSLMELTEKRVISTDQQRLFTEMTQKELSESMKVIDRLLHWSYQQLHGIKIKKKSLMLNEFIKEVTAELQPSLQTKKIDVVIPEKDVSIMFDHDMLKVVMRNLLSNAIKFSHEHSEIVITTELQADFLHLSFSDTGVGMNPEWFQNLMKAGKPEVKAGTKGEEGKGFGLLITKDFVELNGGKLSCESQKGRGTTFSISIPIEKGVEREDELEVLL